jgi:hypothetical protein
MRWTIDHMSPERLQDQVAASVMHGLHSGELGVGEQLPPAAELLGRLAGLMGLEGADHGYEAAAAEPDVLTISHR